jgi:hypothetical protein
MRLELISGHQLGSSEIKVMLFGVSARERRTSRANEDGVRAKYPLSGACIARISIIGIMPVSIFNDRRIKYGRMRSRTKGSQCSIVDCNALDCFWSQICDAVPRVKRLNTAKNRRTVRHLFKDTSVSRSPCYICIIEGAPSVKLCGALIVHRPSVMHHAVTTKTAFDKLSSQ